MRILFLCVPPHPVRASSRPLLGNAPVSAVLTRRLLTYMQRARQCWQDYDSQEAERGGHPDSEPDFRVRDQDVRPQRVSSPISCTHGPAVCSWSSSPTTSADRALLFGSISMQVYSECLSVTSTWRLHAGCHRVELTLSSPFRSTGDVGGQRTLRPYWRNYFEQTDAVVWVVDSGDRLRMEDCKKELEGLLVEDVSSRVHLSSLDATG